ncbi:hypothetical protein [Micromonospora sp. RTGN7]|uniref:hypothetical protein n=1 Tax=Micromonospora sp. RTGN7 TaxID=3016526 RepID=UPI0029FF21F9|nr:hypothetical protein [Micromonospora sp. RTGN7]
MSDPNEATTALPQRDTPGVPGSPGAAEPTAYLGRTVDLGRTTDLGRTVGPERPWSSSGMAEPTAHLAGAAEPTAHWTGPTGGSTPTAVAGSTAGGPVGPPGAVPGGELRFGPGVPGAAAVPTWGQAGPARRPRPAWRRVVSVLSALCTVVLVVAVGFFIWQWLSPLEVEGVTVAVAEPAGNRCDVTVEVVATVRTNGNAGTIRYQWLRSGAAPGALVGERVGRGQRTVTLPLKWSFAGVGTTRETATVNIVEPSVAQASTEVRYVCRRR